jgi:hypothetical protein
LSSPAEGEGRGSSRSFDNAEPDQIDSVNHIGIASCSPLVPERRMNNNEHHRNKEPTMLRTAFLAAAEIMSLAAFGSMVAIWALILAPGA